MHFVCANTPGAIVLKPRFKTDVVIMIIRWFVRLKNKIKTRIKKSGKCNIEIVREKSVRRKSANYILPSS
jgi:hypothetical protein